MLTYLTGKDYNSWDIVLNSKEEKNIPAQIYYENLALTAKTPEKDKGVLFATLGVMGLIAAMGIRQKRKNYNVSLNRFKTYK